MDTAPWPQANSSDPRHLVNEMGLVVTPSQLEDMVPSGAAGAACSARPPQLMERKPRPQREQALSCPRCQSTNTKFCYYNNYSLTQPRYFCKTCRRYWTEGGSLRNVPVGGGSRKNKRPSSSSTVTTSRTASTTPTSSLSSSATSTTSRKLPSDHLAPPPPFQQNPKFHEGQDLNLAFPPQHHMNGTLGDQFPTVESSSVNAGTNPAAANPPTCSSAATSSSISAMELLRSGLSAPFMPMMAAAEAGVAYPSSVFGLQDFRPPTTTTTSLSFSLDGFGGGGYGSVQGVQEGTGGRVFFPYEDLRQVSSTTPAHEIIEQNRVQGTGDPSGFWNGVMGGGAAGSW